MANYNINIDLLKYEHLLSRSYREDKEYILDPVRKRRVVLKPEEHVRQLFLQYLLSDSSATINRIAVEKQIKLNNLSKRFDILIYDQSLSPQTLIECKSPSHKLGQKDLDQMVNYNIVLNASYLILTNGKTTMAWYNINSDENPKKINNINIYNLFNRQ